jgi:hypothetical protein
MATPRDNLLIAFEYRGLAQPMLYSEPDPGAPDAYYF